MDKYTVNKVWYFTSTREGKDLKQNLLNFVFMTSCANLNISKRCDMLEILKKMIDQWEKTQLSKDVLVVGYRSVKSVTLTEEEYIMCVKHIAKEVKDLCINFFRGDKDE